jgi:lipid-binding SYLF domain-containing protein
VIQRFISCVLAFVMLALPLSAKDKTAERFSRKFSTFPQDLLDKAECVIILPSVLKAAFGFGGSTVVVR